ncbi:hypothetical protein [Anaerolinea thermophila]|uniref:hypothetical protein n=1 Tax=Anaerolinea thermophila TaxID=167964 RepID=UPI0026EE2E66|nr:hypothetical protein [Anaerolinea thermophila]
MSSTRGCGIRIHRFALTLILLGLAWASIGRAIWAWTDRDFLIRYSAQPGWEYLLLTGVIWALLALSAAGLTLSGKPRWFRIAFFEIVLWAGLYWVDVLFFSRSGEALLNLGFLVVLTLVGLLYAAFVLEMIPEILSRFRR